ncbi:hypothetical protein AAEH77_00105 [Shewanella xiamenensis]|uniref:hypothetical protein n=1 Tax=Shewanella xiamenensis TaxID=332186 RepID=UPI00313CF668
MTKQVEKFDSDSDSGRGGARPGAGRPKGEPTKMMRIPLGAEDLVKSLLEVYKTDCGAAAASRFRRQLKIKFGVEIQKDLFL